MEVPVYDLPERRHRPATGRAEGRRPAARRHRPRRAGRPPAVRDLPLLLGPGDALVVNTSRVLPARLRLVKATGGAAEVLLLEPDPEPGSRTWQALVRPGRRWPAGTVLAATPAGQGAVEVGERLPGGRRAGSGCSPTRPRCWPRAGRVALPPYIHEPLGGPGALPDGLRRPSPARWRPRPPGST